MKVFMYVLLLVVMGLGVGSIFAFGVDHAGLVPTTNKVVIAGVLREYVLIDETQCAVRIHKSQEKGDFQDALAPVAMCPTLQLALNKEVRIAGFCRTYVSPNGACLCLPIIEAVEVTEIIPTDPTKTMTDSE